ncbi:unnamed protein product [Owenia fusiformis]|uniref:Mitogen-activated protein kinase kinase kinase 19 n=1 Tax=Owenia fusiformis TaxID=6347 RepID=A0A8J1V0M7_OWEFU|nr:unnamed protein product [Owenia fusiformis]
MRRDDKTTHNTNGHGKTSIQPGIRGSTALPNSMARHKEVMQTYNDIASTLFSNGDSNDVEQLFLAAARDGDYDRIENFLQRRSDVILSVDMKDKRTGNTPIIWAAKRGHTKIVQLLLKHGADITLRNYDGKTAVELASPAIKTLLLEAVERNGVSHRNLLQAAWQGNSKAVKKLLSGDKSLDVNCKNADGLTPLLLVTRDVALFEKLGSKMVKNFNPLEVLAELLAHRGDLHSCDEEGKSPLHYVCSSKSQMAAHMAEYLIQQGSDVAMGDRRCFHPLHSASQIGNVDVVLTLLDGGSNPNSRGFAGTTPLHITAYNGHEKAAVTLLDRGADVTLVDDSGLTPVDVAKTKKVKVVLREAWTEATQQKPEATLAPVRIPSRGGSRERQLSEENKQFKPVKKMKGEVIFDSLPSTTLVQSLTPRKLKRLRSLSEKERVLLAEQTEEQTGGAIFSTPALARESTKTRLQGGTRVLGTLPPQPPRTPKSTSSTPRLPPTPEHRLNPLKAGLSPRKSISMGRLPRSTEEVDMVQLENTMNMKSPGKLVHRISDPPRRISDDVDREGLPPVSVMGLELEENLSELRARRLLQNYSSSALSDASLSRMYDSPFLNELRFSYEEAMQATGSRLSMDDFEDQFSPLPRLTPLRIPSASERSRINIPNTIQEHKEAKMGTSVILDLDQMLSRGDPTKMQDGVDSAIYPNSKKLLPSPTSFISQKEYSFHNGRLVQNDQSPDTSSKESSPRSEDDSPRAVAKGFKGTINKQHKLLRKKSLLKEEFNIEDSRVMNLKVNTYGRTESTRSSLESSVSSLSTPSPVSGGGDRVSPGVVTSSSERILNTERSSIDSGLGTKSSSTVHKLGLDSNVTPLPVAAPVGKVPPGKFNIGLKFPTSKFKPMVQSKNAGDKPVTKKPVIKAGSQLQGASIKLLNAAKDNAKAQKVIKDNAKTRPSDALSSPGRDKIAVHSDVLRGGQKSQNSSSIQKQPEGIKNTLVKSKISSTPALDLKPKSSGQRVSQQKAPLNDATNKTEAVEPDIKVKDSTTESGENLKESCQNVATLKPGSGLHSAIKKNKVSVQKVSSQERPKWNNNTKNAKGITTQLAPIDEKNQQMITKAPARPTKSDPTPTKSVSPRKEQYVGTNSSPQTSYGDRSMKKSSSTSNVPIMESLNKTPVRRSLSYSEDQNEAPTLLKTMEFNIGDQDNTSAENLPKTVSINILEHKVEPQPEHTGPVIEDAFEHLKREITRQIEEEKLRKSKEKSLMVKGKDIPKCRNKSAAKRKTSKDSGKPASAERTRKRVTKSTDAVASQSKKQQRPKTAKRKSKGKKKKKLDDGGTIKYDDKMALIGGIGWHISTECNENPDIEVIDPDNMSEDDTPRNDEEYEAPAVETAVERIDYDEVDNDTEPAKRPNTLNIKRPPSAKKFQRALQREMRKALGGTPLDDMPTLIPQTLQAIKDFAKSVKDDTLNQLLGDDFDDLSYSTDSFKSPMSSLGFDSVTKANILQIVNEQTAKLAANNNDKLQSPGHSPMVSPRHSHHTIDQNNKTSPHGNSPRHILQRKESIDTIPESPSDSVFSSSLSSAASRQSSGTKMDSSQFSRRLQELKQSAGTVKEGPGEHAAGSKPDKAKELDLASSESGSDGERKRKNDEDIDSVIDEILFNTMHLKDRNDISSSSSSRYSTKQSPNRNNPTGVHTPRRPSLPRSAKSSPRRVSSGSSSSSKSSTPRSNKGHSPKITQEDSSVPSLVGKSYSQLTAEEEQAGLARVLHSYKQMALKIENEEIPSPTHSTGLPIKRPPSGKRISPPKSGTGKKGKHKGRIQTLKSASSNGPKIQLESASNLSNISKGSDHSPTAAVNTEFHSDWLSFAESIDPGVDEKTLTKTVVDAIENSPDSRMYTSRLGRRSAPQSRAASVASNVSDIEEVINWKKGNQLGKGAFGTVWCGLTNNGELIAVKQLELNTSDMDKAEREYEKIQEEVELLKTLRHENIVGFLGTTLEEHTVSIFMQFVPGGSVANLLARFGALEEAVFCIYTKQILQGVQYLHSNNVIHRDIKGGNIMLMPTGVIKLIDFGCAKKLCINLSISQTSVLKSMRGTPYWMAPEVVNETGHGKKSDIWSVGCTVFEMATRKPPWSNVPPMAAIFAIGSDKPVPRLPETFTLEAQDFVNSTLTRDQNTRPSADELLQHPFILGQKL